MKDARRKEVEKYILQKLEEIRFYCEDVFDYTEMIHMTVSKSRTSLFALNNDEEHVLMNHWNYNA